MNHRDASVLLLVPAGPYRGGEGDRESVVDLPDYYLARLPVTNAAYARFCLATGHPRGRYYGRDFSKPEAPVVGVSWDDAVAYAGWAGLRLPTELEWEKAAGVGIDRAVALHEIAWFRDNSGGCPHPVGWLCANRLGFHDLLGNVWEWTADWYDEDRLYHVVRGGSWKTLAEDLRPTHRDFNPPVERMRCVGFRCACSPPPEVDQGSSPGVSAVSTVGHGQ